MESGGGTVTAGDIEKEDNNVLEFKRNRYGNWVAAVGKWHFQINQTRVGAKHNPKPFWVLAARGSKKDVKSLDTGRHRRFESMEAAAEFCEALAAGKVTLEEIQAQFDAEDAAAEQAAIKAATERARAFRDKLEALNISYATLMDLMDEQMNMGDLSHRILLGYERGEGLPNV